MFLTPKGVFLAIAVFAALVAAGCGGSDGREATEEPDITDAEPPAAETGEEQPPQPAEEPGQETPAETAPSLVASVAEGWTSTVIDAGIKPAIALDSSGSPAVVYLREEIAHGFVKFAAKGTGWQPETVAEGYFYGPIDLAFDPSDRPHVVYHDHQDSEVDLRKGDLVHAVKAGSTWDVSPARDQGHDGWDATIAIGADGTVHGAGIEPSQFNLENGVEYYRLENGSWTVRAIGSGPIAYEFNVSLALDPNGNAALSYYNDRDGNLEFARLVDGGWEIETVASEGDVGKFSSLAFDVEGRPHISFFEQTSATSGIVRYALLDSQGWRLEDIAVLEEVELGQTGARRNSALALDATGSPSVSFSDRGGLALAVRTEDAGWEIEDIVLAGERPLGQLVSFKLDEQGEPHLTFFEVTGTGPLDGLIVYLERR